MDRIPTEILSYIFGFSIQESPPFCSKHGHRKEELAAVSRTWREIILNTPRFWCIINISNRWPLSSVKQHVERSCGHLLDIIIGSCEKESFDKRLDVVIPHIQRWRSLISHSRNKVLTLLLHKLGNSTLPHLVYINVWGSDKAPMRLLRPENTPALERLQLGGLPRDTFPSDDNHVPAGFTFPSQLFSQRLTALSIFVDDCNFSLQPNSIVLPLLTSLSFRAVTPRELMEAIVAPQLVSFSFKKYRYNMKLFDVFDDLGPKYSNVQDLLLCGSFYKQELGDAEAICLTFPKVQNVEMAVEEVPAFFGTDEDNTSPADYWDHLQCIVINFSGFWEADYSDELESWLERRNAGNQSKLRVVLMNFPNEDYGMKFSDEGTMSDRLPDLLEPLNNHCIVEIINGPVRTGAGLTVHTNFPPQWVGVVV